jgi:formylmethanofuran dehydrogenase subunit B
MPRLMGLPRHIQPCRSVAEFGPVTCAGCGLLCDDVTVEAAEDGITLRPECGLGAAWFAQSMLASEDAPAARIDGEPADVESALARAAELLSGARRPLVQGFEHATVEDARAAVALADRLGAVIATGSVAGTWRGASTATLGEIRDRSEVVVIWREDPETTHPRLLDRLGFGRGSRSGRVLMVIDDHETRTTERADLSLVWTRERDLQALVALHLLADNASGADGALDMPLRDLVERVRRVPHATFVYGAGLTGGAGGQRRALALHELVRALCRERHAVALELPSAPGTRSADDVLAWQSGYSGQVDFAGGHPELAMNPLDDVDVALRVESGPGGSAVAGPGAEVWIRTAAAGVEATGTAHRLDGVPLALQAPRPTGAPTPAALLTRLLEQVRR